MKEELNSSPDSLSFLFNELKNEASTTSIAEVNLLLVSAIKGTVALGLIAKLKLVFIKKTMIMTLSSILVGTAVVSGLYFGTNNTQNNTDVKINQVKKQKVITVNKQIEKMEDKSSIPVLSTPIQPIINVEEKTFQTAFEFTPLMKKNWLPPALTSVPRMSNVGSFTKINVSGSMSINLKSGTTPSYEIIGTDEQKELVSIVEKDGELFIRPGKSNNRKNVPEINVYVSQLERITISGASEINGTDELVSKNLEIVTTGASDVSLNVNLKQLTIQETGASDIKIKGSCDQAIISCEGASELKMKDCVVQSAKIDCSGASEMTMNVKIELSGKLTGASEFTHVGKPEKLQLSSSGASEINEL